MKIVLADDHPVFIAGVRAYLNCMPDCCVVASVTSSDALIGCLESTPCDLVITEFSMPMTRVGDGLHLLSYIKRHYPEKWVIVLTLSAIPMILHQIITSGVNGLLHKSDEISDLGKAIRRLGDNALFVGQSFQGLLQTASDGQTQNRIPSPRETEVLRLYAAGNSLRDISIRLNKSVKTVSLQKASAMKKLGLRNDVELGRYYATASGDIIQPMGHHGWVFPEINVSDEEVGN